MTPPEPIAVSPLRHCFASRALGFTSSPPSRRILVPLALIAWTAILLCDGLVTGPFYRTESLRALVADEMQRSGNWIVPRRYDQPLLTKPPVAYIAIGLASWPTGTVTEWTARLPSVLAALATLLLLRWHVARRAGSIAGLLVLCLLPMSFLWLEKVPTAEIDALQVFWVTAALVCAFRALDEISSVAPDCRREQVWWLLALFCVACGLLTKWTAPAFFYLTLIPLLWRRRQLRLLWGRSHLLAAGCAGLICLAWIIAAAHQAGWELLRDTVAREGLMRLSPAHHDRAYPWLEVLAHPARLLAAALPASAVCLLVFGKGFAQQWDERVRRLLQELHCWVWPGLLFWSIIPEHAVRHSFPLLPGIVGLAALVWTGWLQGRLHWPFRRCRPGYVLVALMLCWLGAKLYYIHVLLPERTAQRGALKKGEELARTVPAGESLFLFHPRDDSLEGVIFYYRKARCTDAVKRIGGPERLPSGMDCYCIVSREDWDVWPEEVPAEALCEVRDELDVPLLLVRACVPPCNARSDVGWVESSRPTKAGDGSRGLDPPYGTRSPNGPLTPPRSVRGSSR